MNARKHIEQWGFFPEIVDRVLSRSLGGAEPVALVHQIDAAFDHGSMFRHLTVAALGTDVLVHIHIDELENGGAGVATAIHPLSSLTGMSVMEMVARPSEGCVATEVTVALNLGGARRSEIEPARCDDPECMADHGYSATTFPDDLTIRVSEAADGPDAMAQAQHFVDALSAVLARTRRG